MERLGKLSLCRSGEEGGKETSGLSRSKGGGLAGLAAREELRALCSSCIAGLRTGLDTGVIWLRVLGVRITHGRSELGFETRTGDKLWTGSEGELTGPHVTDGVTLGITDGVTVGITDGVTVGVTLFNITAAVTVGFAFGFDTTITPGVTLTLMTGCNLNTEVGGKVFTGGTEGSDVTRVTDGRVTEGRVTEGRETKGRVTEGKAKEADGRSGEGCKSCPLSKAGGSSTSFHSEKCFYNF